MTSELVVMTDVPPALQPTWAVVMKNPSRFKMIQDDSDSHAMTDVPPALQQIWAVVMKNPSNT